VTEFDSRTNQKSKVGNRFFDAFHHHHSSIPQDDLGGQYQEGDAPHKTCWVYTTVLDMCLSDSRVSASSWAKCPIIVIEFQLQLELEVDAIAFGI
jgi:hypothetical protein